MKTKVYSPTSIVFIIFFLLVQVISLQGNAQIKIIYDQSFNTAFPDWPAGWTALPSTAGWLMDTSIANASSGYSGASGGAMTVISDFISGSSVYDTMYSNIISTVGYTQMTASYAARNSKHFSDNGSKITQFAYSIDGGITWTNIPFTENANDSYWHLINNGVSMQLGTDANNASVMFRWIAYIVATPSGTYRIDDFTLSGDTVQTAVVDTLKILNYNVNNYGYYDAGNCPTQTPIVKNNYLRTILKYTNPDIIGLTKMEATTSMFYTDTLPRNILDSVCDKCYAYGAYTNLSGYYKENMLYYNTNKLGFISTTTIYSDDPGISDINHHKLYYKSPALSTTHDTIFLNIILVHDESGSKDSSQRASEIGGAMDWLDSYVTNPGNYIFMGDFNVQGATEQCFQDMVNPSNSNVTFYDPVNQLGNWTKHASSYAYYLTQSTRVTDPGDCGATGGINNRYDQILCNGPIINGSDSLKYIEGSYIVIGQDGNHVNNAINAAPTNTSVPANVLTALYQMSEHLPVMLKLRVNINSATGIKTALLNQALSIKYNTIVSDVLMMQQINGSLKSQTEGTLHITNLQGRLIKSMPFDFTASNSYFLSYLPRGMYLFSITQNYQPLFNGKFIKL